MICQLTFHLDDSWIYWITPNFNSIYPMSLHIIKYAINIIIQTITTKTISY